VLWIFFFSPEKSDGFGRVWTPRTLGSKGQHGTSRPPKPLISLSRYAIIRMEKTVAEVRLFVYGAYTFLLSPDWHYCDVRHKKEGACRSIASSPVIKKIRPVLADTEVNVVVYVASGWVGVRCLFTAFWISFITEATSVMATVLEVSLAVSMARCTKKVQFIIYDTNWWMWLWLSMNCRGNWIYSMNKYHTLCVCVEQCRQWLKLSLGDAQQVTKLLLL
jgi:hypothetical protein